MYQSKRYFDGYEIFELVETETDSWFRFAPHRGGLITSFGVNGAELLYLDMETFREAGANVRGGVPILFPICGKLQHGQYEVAGKTYTMKSHGFARNQRWMVEKVDVQDQASVTLRLTSNQETLEEFPFEFDLIFTYLLKNGKLMIQQSYTNNSSVPMPMYSGFHPYFQTVGKRIEVATDATQYLDYNDLCVKPFTGSIDLSHMVESAFLFGGHQNHISFTLPDTRRTVRIDYGREFKQMVFWTVQNRDFVCVEPWMAGPDAMNTQQDLVYVEPGETLDTYVTIGLA